MLTLVGSFRGKKCEVYIAVCMSAEVLLAALPVVQTVYHGVETKGQCLSSRDRA